jgi:hypothetical protein
MRISSALALLVAIGCTGNRGTVDRRIAATEGGKGDAWSQPSLGAARFADWDDMGIVAKHLAVGNGAHRIGTYDPATFDASAVAAGLRAHYADIGCSGRIYSSSQVDAVAKYVAYTDQDDFQERVLDEGGDAAQTADDMRAIVEDPTNRAVFSAEYDPDSDDDPAGCDIADFFVFRSGGTVVHFNFDHSD